MTRTKVAYIAGPFRGPTPWDVAENVREAERVGLRVAQAGAMPLIPHANTSLFDGQLTGQFWLDGTMELLRRCDCVVLTHRWKESSGALAEHGEATRLGLPVWFDAPYASVDGLRDFISGVPKRAVAP